MRKVDQLLGEYGSSHVNRTNKMIHWICVPPIVWTVVAMLWAVPFPAALTPETVPMNWAIIGVIISMVYYFKLSFRLGLGVLAFLLFLLWLSAQIEALSPWPLWAVAVTVFVVAWIGQFIGHIFEGARPSFMKDLQFLMIGPMWLMSFLYRKAGLSY